MRKFLIWLMAFILCLGVYYIYFKTEWVQIKSIEYNENANIDLYEIQRYSGVAIGDRYFQTPIKDALEGLSHHPYVLSVSGSKVFPNKVVFELTYRHHFMNVQYAGITLSLDDTLTVLKVLDAPAEGYTITGFEFDSFTTGDTIRVPKKYVLENIVLLIKLMEASHLNEGSSISYKNDHILVHIGDMVGKFGNGDRIQERFNAFVNIYETLLLEDVTFGVIDVSTDGLPAYRPFGD